MRILLFRGTFSPNRKNHHTGLICCCHVYHGDLTKINSVVIALSKQRKSLEERIIIIPFSRLGKPEMRISYACAKNILYRVNDSLPNAVFLRYRRKNNFNLEVPPGSFVDYLEI